MAFRRRRWRDARPEEDRVRVNRAIRSPEVRVVNEDGQQLGIMPSHAALDIAGRVGLDLVEIAANANPPVCKIMDYGRYKFEIKKKAASAKKAQHQSQLKEIKLRPRIDEHDLDFKVKNARKFLIGGDKVKCTVMFRGREIVHSHLGRELLKVVTSRLEDIAGAEGQPSMEGRTLSVTFAPNRQAIAKYVAEQRKAGLEVEGHEPDESDEFDESANDRSPEDESADGARADGASPSEASADPEAASSAELELP